MNSVIDNIEQIASAATSVAETKFELLKLKAADKVSVAVSAVAMIFVVVLLGSIALIVLSFGLAFFIGNRLGDVSYGFFIIGGVFALAGFLFYANRKKWVQEPLTSILIDKLIK